MSELGRPTRRRQAGRPVILKTARVEDQYDRARDIPALKRCTNGGLSDAWDFTRDIRAGEG